MIKRVALRNLTVDELIEEFVAVGVAQDQAELLGETRKFRPLFQRKIAIEDELKGRPGDQRRALIPLYDHDNLEVRLNAAKATLAVAPLAVRKALEAIKATYWHPQAAEAGMTLNALREGRFKPT